MILLSNIIAFCHQQDRKQEKFISKDTIEVKENEGPKYSEWTKYDINGFGEIYIPPELEIQAGKYKEISDKYREINGLTEEQIVFQQSGLNEFDKEAFKTYARVMVKTRMEKVGDISTLYGLHLSKKELKQLDKILKEQLEGSLKSQSMKITKWFPVEIVIVNNMTALLQSYNRQMGDNPEVYVRLYQFHNYDRIHYITLSYRIADKEIWEPLFENILNSLKIIEIK